MDQVRQIVMIRTEGFGERRSRLSGREEELIVATNMRIAVIAVMIVRTSISRRTT